MRTNIYSGLGRILLALLFCCNGLFAQNDALHFDGNNDYITLSPIQGFAPNSDFTAEAWFTCVPDGLPCNGANFRRLISLGGPQSRYEVGQCGGDLVFFWSNAFGTNGPTTTLLAPFGINIQDGNWHCISVVRNGNFSEIFVDGISVYNEVTFAAFNNTLFRVGHWPGGGATPNQDWLGLVDEVKLWGTFLTPANLTACDPCVLKGTEPGLVAYWQFDEGIANGNNSSITQTPDATPIGNNGVLSSPTLTPPGFTLTNASGLSNYTSSTAPVLYPQYNNTSLLLSDPLQTIALTSICSGDAVHFSIIEPNGNPSQAGAGTSVQWYYSDDGFITSTLITPGLGALFSGFSFVSPPGHLATSKPSAPNAFVDREYQAVITVTNGQNTCTYTVTSIPLRICCPIQNTQINVSPMGPLCEGDMVQFTASVSSNMPPPSSSNNVHINWCVIINGGTPIPLSGPLYTDQVTINYPVGLLTVTPGSICFQAKISNCACPSVTVQKCVTIDPKPVCGTITGCPTPATLMPDPDGNPDHYLICPGDDAAIMIAMPFLNCIPIWQYMFPSVGTWNDLGTSNSKQNTNVLPHLKPASSPYLWPVGETCIVYRIKCVPPNNPSGCPPCYSNEVQICLKQPPPPPVITAVPSSICKGGNSFLSVQNPDPNCTYEWYGNGLLVGFGDFLNTSNTPITGSACYWVTCNDGCFTVASNKVCVTVCEPVARICCPVPICPCEGDPITLSGQEGPCSFGNCGPLTYAWSWTDINGQPQTATTPTITDIPAPGPLGTTYTLTVMDSIGCTDTTMATVVPCPN